MEQYYQSKFKARDAILIVGVLAFAILVFIFMHTVASKDGDLVRITVDGAVYGEYALEQDQQIKVKQDGTVTNIVEIEDGVVHMEKATCPDALCITQGKIRRANESLICLPNKVVVEIIANSSSKEESSSDQDEIDAVIK